MKIKVVDHLNLVEELPGDNGNAFSSSKRLYHKIKVNEEMVLAKEAIDWEVGDDERGGMIILSRTVNAIPSSNNRIINWIKQKAKTLNNKIFSNKKIDDISKKHNLVGWTVGHFLDGRYTSKNGTAFGEDSISIELVGIDTDTLIDVATDICNAFDQETVLVKCYNNGKIYFVNGDYSDNTLDEDLKNHIYMIRRDGKILDLKERYVHPLLKPNWTLNTLINNLYDILSDLCFYYLNTNNKETKKNIYHLMCMLLYYNPSASYQTKRYGVDIKEEDLYKEEPFDLQGIYTEVAEECAQEFIKVRLGGKFNSNDRDLNEVVFRIASTGFNWFDNICNFLISHKKDIESVTIVRDKELTGNEEVYSIDGEEIYRYPVEDFIMIKGRPIIESKYDFLNKLSRGNTILEAYGVSNFRHALSEFYHYRKFDKFEM